MAEVSEVKSIIRNDGYSSKISLECIDSGQSFILEIPKDASSDSEENILKDLQIQLAELLELSKPFDFNQLLTLDRLKVRTVDIENELASVEEIFKTYKQRHLSYIPQSEEATDEEIARLIKEE